jgi:DNA-binding response OmpR family regulator
MAKLLLIEDDYQLAEVTRAFLESERFMVEMTGSGVEGYELLVCSDFNLAIIDWNLPGMSGPEICQKYRRDKGTTPIIMLTARRSIAEKEIGFDAGADDYLTKPFEMKELLLRVNAILRRTGNAIDDLLRAQDIVLDPRKFKVTRASVEIPLLPREFALLEFFMRRPGQVFNPTEILRNVWKSDADVTDDALKSCLKRLRQKIDRDGEDSVIESIPRVGYRIRV